MIGRHTYAPLIYPGDEALNARDEAARKGSACFVKADDLATALDRRDSEWSAADARMLDALNELLDQASEIVRRLSP